MRSSFSRLVLVATLLAGLSACAVNPVTGQYEFAMVSESEEIKLGTDNYGYMQQAGGGEYDVDPELTEYVRAVGGRLVAASHKLSVTGRRLPYEFIVLNVRRQHLWDRFSSGLTECFCSS